MKKALFKIDEGSFIDKASEKKYLWLYYEALL